MFFYCLEVALQRYKSSSVKRVEDAFFLIMGLNHLREWIAPGYNHKQPADTDAKRLYLEIYDLPEFKIINALCNRSKHLAISQETGYRGELTVSEWPDLASVLRIDEGPPSAFYVNNEEIEKPLSRLLEEYRNKWFSLC